LIRLLHVSRYGLSPPSSGLFSCRSPGRGNRWRRRSRGLLNPNFQGLALSAEHGQPAFCRRAVFTSNNGLAYLGIRPTSSPGSRDWTPDLRRRWSYTSNRGVRCDGWSPGRNFLSRPTQSEDGFGRLIDSAFSSIANQRELVDRPVLRVSSSACLAYAKLGRGFSRCTECLPCPRHQLRGQNAVSLLSSSAKCGTAFAAQGTFPRRSPARRRGARNSVC
jgi:hypothetical protein